MLIKRCLAATFCALALTGMRDPFRPPEDRCQIAQLSRWRYQGVISMRGRHIGLLRDARGKWQRVEQGDALSGGWWITRLAEAEMVVNIGEGCEPQQWTWQRGEKGDVEMDNAGADRHHIAGESG